MNDSLRQPSPPRKKSAGMNPATILVGILIFLPVAAPRLACAQEKWSISTAAIFPGGPPANDHIRQLVRELGREEGIGVPLSLREFRAHCDRALPTVYRDQLIKYATPRSIAIQNQEHRDYSRVFMQERRLRAGVAFLRREDRLLRAVEAAYGVARHDVVAILMWESGLGEFVGDYRVFNIFLGQLLYLDAAREAAIRDLEAAGTYDPARFPSPARQQARLGKLKDRAVKNLVALLRVAKDKGIDPTRQVGSWGGSMGYAQFAPASLRFAADGDRDGTIDLNHWPDAIFSVASYLQQHGYDQSYAGRKRGIHAYNPINSYVTGVIRYADAIWQRYRNSG